MQRVEAETSRNQSEFLRRLFERELKSEGSSRQRLAVLPCASRLPGPSTDDEVCQGRDLESLRGYLCRQVRRMPGFSSSSVSRAANFAAGAPSITLWSNVRL